MPLDNAQCLVAHFDCVVMLTWSDWKTEPRSNRFHYATRFARYLPVIFVQPDLKRSKAEFEKTEIEQLEILHVFSKYGRTQNSLINQALLAHGFIKPLLWVYNPNFGDYVAHRYSPLKVYHATEDYFNPYYDFDDDFFNGFKRVLKHTDLIVAVSEDVLNSYIRNGEYQGITMLLKNGCDFKFWAPTEENFRSLIGRDPEKKVALFQGGINRRLDWEMLYEISEKLPDWEIWLCGALGPGINKQLRYLQKNNSNVKYLGYLNSDQLREVAYKATVGIIPFLQNDLIKASLPLKAFEYAACGLPVVSVPIKALESYDGLFEFATSADEFVCAMEKVSPTRYIPSAIESRLKVAQEQDYDSRFDSLLQRIDFEIRHRKPNPGPLKVLMLYDANSVHVNTIREYLNSFSMFSRSQIAYATATNGVECTFDLSPFDVVIFHYSIRLCYEWHLSPSFAQAVRNFGGYKVMFIQDEYDTTETTRKWIERLGLHVVFTCVPDEYVDLVYPSSRFPSLERSRVLTGYVPLGIETKKTKPISERKIAIGYRGRPLPFYYGDLGREKIVIAQKMREICQERGIPVDIEWTEEKRIYGDGWYSFIESCKATLGTESGSNVFDDYGEIKANIERALEKDPALSYEAIHSKYIAEQEGIIKMNQISPRVFEAIALRTALILFEGNYSGVVQPDVHYIPLKKDFSNVDDVLNKLQDVEYLEALTERAYKDVITSGQYSYQQFISDFDKFLAQRIQRSSDDRLLLGVIGTYRSNQPGIETIPYGDGRISMRNSVVTISPSMSRDAASTAPFQNFVHIKDVLNVVKSGAYQSYRLTKTGVSQRLQNLPNKHKTIYTFYKLIARAFGLQRKR